MDVGDAQVIRVDPHGSCVFRINSQDLVAADREISGPTQKKQVIVVTVVQEPVVFDDCANRREGGQIRRRSLIEKKWVARVATMENHARATEDIILDADVVSPMEKDSSILTAIELAVMDIYVIGVVNDYGRKIARPLGGGREGPISGCEVES